MAPRVYTQPGESFEMAPLLFRGFNATHVSYIACFVDML